MKNAETKKRKEGRNIARETPVFAKTMPGRRDITRNKPAKHESFPLRDFILFSRPLTPVPHSFPAKWDVSRAIIFYHSPSRVIQQA
ncbi:MAG: hypothetical protein L6455_12700 [Kiritimatiellae bacterium]|nr:hypothetical protein [Kiritimatiellia bacterium]